MAPPGSDAWFEATLADARRGRPAGFTSLFEWLAPTVAGWCRAHGAAEPDDLTSEVFLRAFRGLPAFEGDVTFVDGELWHGTWEDDRSELRRISPESGEILETLEMPAEVKVSGLESDGADLFYAGGGASGKVRAVRRPAQPAEPTAGSCCAHE